ncbi:hypothetical protein HOE31_01000 [bacterium]|nr:hypothetical protein [bacterium]MBT4121513.1 hypothetical protein [bacterium]MBT4495693.1 hypothetical protein [bacterium]MBT5942884.1 hypothetical protein [bacterium]MBT6067822.1 hypothetical protein [bacterium]
MLHLIPDTEKEQLLVLLEKREMIQRMIIEQEQVEDNILKTCSELNIPEDQCAHPENLRERSAGGGHFCILCNKMVGMD